MHDGIVGALMFTPADDIGEKFESGISFQPYSILYIYILNSPVQLIIIVRILVENK
jgi:hypothetical protein